jgi:hypothetical protein
MQRGGAAIFAGGCHIPTENPDLKGGVEWGVSLGVMPQTADFQTEFDELRRVKAEALSRWVKAQEFHRQCKLMMQELITKGFSQADIAR